VLVFPFPAAYLITQGPRGPFPSFLSPGEGPGPLRSAAPKKPSPPLPPPPFFFLFDISFVPPPQSKGRFFLLSLSCKTTHRARPLFSLGQYYLPPPFFFCRMKQPGLRWTFPLFSFPWEERSKGVPHVPPLSTEFFFPCGRIFCSKFLFQAPTLLMNASPLFSYYRTAWDLRRRNFFSPCELVGSFPLSNALAKKLALAETAPPPPPPKKKKVPALAPS